MTRHVRRPVVPGSPSGIRRSRSRDADRPVLPFIDSSGPERTLGAHSALGNDMLRQFTRVRTAKPDAVHGNHGMAATSMSAQ